MAKSKSADILKKIVARDIDEIRDVIRDLALTATDVVTFAYTVPQDQGLKLYQALALLPLPPKAGKGNAQATADRAYARSIPRASRQRDHQDQRSR